MEEGPPAAFPLRDIDVGADARGRLEDRHLGRVADGLAVLIRRPCVVAGDHDARELS